MASEGPKCSICCEHFDDVKLCPRLLNCGHCFCSSCLEKLLNDKTVSCPTCRKEVSVPASVTGLPKNFALLDIVLTTPQRADDDVLICEVCDDEEHPATSRCLDCKEDMCKTAARFHIRNKATHDHRLVSLEELKANPKLAAVPVFCAEHNEQFRFFDEECNHVVCRDCVTLKHNGHKCLSLAEAASKYRQEMEALATKAGTHIEEIKAAEPQVAGVSCDLNRCYVEEAAKIQGIFKELHEALTAREQVLMNELDQLHKTRAFTLTEQQDRLRIFQACLQSSVQRAMSAVQSPGHAELLVARSDIVATLGAMDSKHHVLQPQADCFLGSTVHRGQLLDMLSNAGIVFDKTTITTCAATITATGLGIRSALSGKEASFTIYANDAQSCLQSPLGDMFTVELKGENKVEGNFTDNHNGYYNATYTVPANAMGDHTLSVLIRGTHIRGSPFVVQIVPVGKVACYSCGQQTNPMIYYTNKTESNCYDNHRVYCPARKIKRGSARGVRVYEHRALCNAPNCSSSYGQNFDETWVKINNDPVE